MFLSESQQQQLFQARLTGLAHAMNHNLLQPFLKSYPDLATLANDPNAVKTIVAEGHSEQLAYSFKRWADNCQEASRLGCREFTPREILQLGASQEEMVTIGIVFQNLYVLAHTEPGDLVLAHPDMSIETAQLIVANSKKAYEAQNVMEPHLHQVQAFTLSPDGKMTEVGSLPPYDPSKPNPDRLRGIIDLLEDLEVIKKPEKRS